MEDYIFQSEKVIITSGNLSKTKDSECGDIYVITNYIVSGQFLEALNHPCIKQIINPNDVDGSQTNFVTELIQNINASMCPGDKQNLQREYFLLCGGICFLQLFIQNNWVGPPTKEWNNVGKELKEGSILNELAIDAEPIYNKAKHPSYLLLAKSILLDCRHLMEKCQTSGWWLIRYIQIHQGLLEERSPTFKSTILDLVDRVQKIDSLMTEDSNRELKIQFEVEAGHLSYFYYEPKLAKEHFSRARKVSCLDISLTGALGKRTRYQEEDKAQLVLKVIRNDACVSEELSDNESVELPKDVDLNDDTVLNQIQFKDTDEDLISPLMNLSATEQSMILGLCHEHRRSHEGIGDIVRGESLAYLNAILVKPKSWSVASHALFLRTMWESESVRRAERSLTQLEELVQQYNRDSVNPAQRIHLLFSSQFKPRWIIEKEQGTFLLKIGAIKSALDVYLRLELWEEIIKCYKTLGQTEKAEKAIRAQLETNETPSLWCHLGDVLNDPECYQKSWQLSNCRFSKAQRCLGYYYLYKAQFEDALEHFEKSLEINSLQIGVWFSYGCTSMGCSKWDKAVKAFQRCVMIDYDNFEAWSNLATAYVRMNNKPKAFNALQEALKCEYENWKVWENFLFVSTDIGQFAELVRAYHRLIELKDKYVDVKVLEVLVKAINENLKDYHDKPTESLKPRALELFGRLTSKVTTNADVWRLYASLLTGGSSEASQSDKERALQYLQKSHRCSTQTMGWEKDVEKCKAVADEACSLAQNYSSVVQNMENKVQSIQLLSSSRLMLKGNLSKIKLKHTDPVSKELLSDLKEPCSKLESELQNIEQILSDLKSS